MDHQFQTQALEGTLPQTATASYFDFGATQASDYGGTQSNLTQVRQLVNACLIVDFCSISSDTVV
jgi:hypothetical protein